MRKEKKGGGGRKVKKKTSSCIKNLKKHGKRREGKWGGRGGGV